MTAALDAGRHDAGRDDRRLEQPEVIAREVKHLRQARDVRPGAEIHAQQPQHRLVDHTQPGLHRRLRDRIAPMHSQVDGHVEHLRPLGKIHSQEEDVAPAAMRKVHADRGALAQDRAGAVGRALQQFAPDAQRMIERMPHPEHPLVAAHGPDAAPDLVGQGLERQPVIGGRQRAGHAVPGPRSALQFQKTLHRLLEPAVQQVLITGERNESPGTQTGARRQVKAMDGGEEEQRPDPVVETAGLPAERLQRARLGQQLLHPQPGAGLVEGTVPKHRVCSRDDGDQLGLHDAVPGLNARTQRRGSRAISSTRPVRTSSRSRPSSASASWAVRRP